MNNFELALLEKLGIKYPVIKYHIPFLRIKNRENTGVGMYVNFDAYIVSNDVNLIEPQNTALSNNCNIEIQGLKDGLGYEVDVLDGKINFIEIFTYGELWDGKVDNFRIV